MFSRHCHLSRLRCWGSFSDVTPSRLPIVGNALQLPKRKPRISFEKRSEHCNNTLWQCGDISYRRSSSMTHGPLLISWEKWRIVTRLVHVIVNTNTNQTHLEYGYRLRIHRKLTIHCSNIPLDCSVWSLDLKPFVVVPHFNAMKPRCWSSSSEWQ